MTWRIPKAGEMIRVNPDFHKLAYEKSWQKTLWYAYLMGDDAFKIERISESEHTIGIKLFESPISISVSRESGRIWWSANGPQMFLLEEEDDQVSS